MSVFLSTFVNKLDKKGRVCVPASFRAALEKQSSSGTGAVALRSYVCDGIDVWGADMMEKLVAQVDTMDMFSKERSDFSAVLFADCEPLSFDPEGRIVLSESLISHGKIEDKVAFVGCGMTFQMWNPDLFSRYKEEARGRLQSGRVPLSFQRGA